MQRNKQHEVEEATNILTATRKCFRHIALDYVLQVCLLYVFKNCLLNMLLGFPHSSVGKESASNAGDLGLIPGSGRSPGEGNGNPLQFSCLKNPMDRGAWKATAQRVAKSWTRLSDYAHTRTV